MAGEWYAQLAATAASSVTSCPADSWVDAFVAVFTAANVHVGSLELTS
jgi:hypothetical protein